jgi:formate hydrogenlyase subunit 3/multisubunit Na+/H+ antiporter MnhD subunit
MIIPGSVLLIALLFVAAGGVYFLRRVEPLAALVAAGISALLAVALWRLPIAAIRLAGRTVTMGQSATWQDLSLQLSAANRPLLVFLLATAAFTFILAWRTYQGRTFHPFGLAMVALWAIAALVRPLIYAPLALVLVGILAVFLIQAGRPGDTRGAWRQLIFPVLAVPLFMVAAWYIEQGPLNPDDPTPYRIAGWLIIAGFILLLQPAPLHVAVPSVAGQAPPVVAVFLWIGGQTTVLFLLQRFLATYPWMGSAIDSARWLLWLGIFTALLSGLLSATQTTLGRLIGYASLFDYGVLLVAMGLRGTAGLPTVIWLILTRTLAMLTVALGAASIRHYMEGDRIGRIAGAASRLPLSVLALIMGGFALVGMPLTAQFASRWALLELLSENDPRWAWLLLIGGVGVMLGVIRAGRACFGSLSGSPVHRESRSVALLAALLVIIGVLVGLFPQLLTGPVSAVILPLASFGP